MKINNSIEIKIKMHTESQNHTSTQEKNERTYFYIKKSEGRTGIWRHDREAFSRRGYA